VAIGEVAHSSRCVDRRTLPVSLPSRSGPSVRWPPRPGTISNRLATCTTGLGGPVLERIIWSNQLALLCCVNPKKREPESHLQHWSSHHPGSFGLLRCRSGADVCCSPESDAIADLTRDPSWATTGLMHRSKHLTLRQEDTLRTRERRITFE